MIHTHTHTHTHTHNGILLSHKKEWNFAICDNTDGPRGYYAKWNKADRKRNTVWFHLYVESKKQNKWTNKTKQERTHRYREQTGGCQKGEGSGDRLNRVRGLRVINFLW